MTLNALLLGGPGLDSYAYKAALYCVKCGRDEINHIWWHGVTGTPPAKEWKPDDPRFRETDHMPQPGFFSESDQPEHCAHCRDYLFGSHQVDHPTDEMEIQPDTAALLDEAFREFEEDFPEDEEDDLGGES